MVYYLFPVLFLGSYVVGGISAFWFYSTGHYVLCFITMLLIVVRFEMGQQARKRRIARERGEEWTPVDMRAVEAFKGINFFLWVTGIICFIMFVIS